MPPRVNDHGHFFQHDDGSPFFYLADTAWMLFNKLTDDDARRLFKDRAEKGFTVIQSVVFRDLFDPNTPNVAGAPPFLTEADMHAVEMNPVWLDRVVRLTRLAGEYGLVMGLLPTWGDKWNAHSNSAGPVIMDASSGRRYCRRLSDRLGECGNVIWILGGDSPLQTRGHVELLRAMAEGIRAGASGDRLIAFHPPGPGSSEALHSEPWLDFHALQTSHIKPNVPNYAFIERLFGIRPAKPCLDMEPNYELSPMFAIGWHGVQPPRSATFSAYDVRKAYYRSVLAGAAGFTYGCEPVRQLVRRGDRVHVWDGVDMPLWTDAIHAPGSSQLAMLKGLLLERSYFTRVPAQELLLPLRQAGAWADELSIAMPSALAHNTDPVAHIAAARCSEGGYVMAYTPVRQMVILDTAGLRSKRLRLSAYNPETGDREASYELDNPGELRFMPRRDLDTLLVIDAI